MKKTIAKCVQFDGKFVIKLIISVLSNYSCDIGYYCPGGTAQQIQCDNGYYQDTPGMASCDLCDAGHFCDNTGAIVILGNSTLCPAGYYCPNGTSFSTENPCPVGTFNSLQGKTKVLIDSVESHRNEIVVINVIFIGFETE